MTMTSSPKSFLLATWEAGGAVAPVLTVARKLLARGHRVRVMSDRATQPEAEAVGAEFRPWTRAPSRADRTPASEVVKDWTCEGPEGLRHTLEVLWTGPALAYAQDIVEELSREPADLVVTSEMLFGVAVGCEAVGQRFCALTCNVSIYPIEGVPPLGPGLPPARSEADRALHAEVAAFNLALFNEGLPAVNAARAALGLQPLAHTLDQMNGAAAYLLGTARAFDFAPARLPPHIRYVGPQLGEPAWAQPWRSPWPADDTRPLVLVAFSTTFQNHAAVLQRIADAAGELPVRALITLGGSIRPEAISPPANVRLVDSAPHDAVMRQAAVVVTHGGHGTVCRALAHLRPLLVMPHGRDQADNAVRVVERGAGLTLPPTAGAEEIRGALQRLLDDPAFAEGAARLGGAVAREAAQSPVVAELEALAEAPALCPA